MGGPGSGGWQKNQAPIFVDEETRQRLWEGLRDKIVKGDRRATSEWHLRLADEVLRGNINGTTAQVLIAIMKSQWVIAEDVDRETREKRLDRIEKSFSSPPNKSKLRDVGPPPDDLA